jgi:type I restriction enzyme M protein
MSTEANRIVQKLWSYCTVLRDDGLSYGDYLEQLSVLLFLKLAHEQTLPPWNQESPVPEGYDWSTSASNMAFSGWYSARRRTRSRIPPNSNA